MAQSTILGAVFTLYSSITIIYDLFSWYVFRVLIVIGHRYRAITDAYKVLFQTQAYFKQNKAYGGDYIYLYKSICQDDLM